MGRHVIQTSGMRKAVAVEGLEKQTKDKRVPQARSMVGSVQLCAGGWSC